MKEYLEQNSDTPLDMVVVHGEFCYIVEDPFEPGFYAIAQDTGNTYVFSADCELLEVRRRSI